MERATHHFHEVSGGRLKCVFDLYNELERPASGQVSTYLVPLSQDWLQLRDFEGKDWAVGLGGARIKNLGAKCTRQPTLPSITAPAQTAPPSGQSPSLIWVDPCTAQQSSRDHGTGRCGLVGDRNHWMGGHYRRRIFFTPELPTNQALRKSYLLHKDQTLRKGISNQGQWYRSDINGFMRIFEKLDVPTEQETKDRPAKTTR